MSRPSSPTTHGLEDRLPVWKAFSELFLDSDLQGEDYDRIARVVARSPYSEAELWDILRYEVYPVCRRNLRSVAGEWSGFDDDWLIGHVAPRCGRRPLFHWLGLHGWAIRGDFRRILESVNPLRVSGR